MFPNCFHLKSFNMNLNVSLKEIKILCEVSIALPKKEGNKKTSLITDAPPPPCLKKAQSTKQKFSPTNSFLVPQIAKSPISCPPHS